ncbi:unnamed protein product [Bemisia tabaci]|uniref:Uncharacterized protein n=1 Tax=Bemisia tabaci TaxID=7038 RepID=A0A9P0APN8_BEMTA|nr:unnamed protein product [Bemisia tabaci]
MKSFQIYFLVSTYIFFCSQLVVFHSFGIPADPGGIIRLPVATTLPTNKGATDSTSYAAKKENTNENIWNGRTSGKENLFMLKNETFQSAILQPRMLGSKTSSPSDSTPRSSSFRDSLRRTLTGELGTPVDWGRKFTDGLRRTLSRPSVTATAKWFASMKGLDDSVVDDTHDTDEDKKKPLKLNFQPKKSMYRDDRPSSPHPQAKDLREKNKAYMDRVMHNRLVEKALRYLGRSGSEPKQEDIDEYVFRKKSLDRSSRQHSFDSSDDESDKDLAILSGNESDPSARSPRSDKDLAILSDNESDPSARSPRSPDRRRPRSPERNCSPKRARPRSPETKPPEREQSRSPQSLNPANEKRDRLRLNLDWKRQSSQSGVRDQKRQSEGANQQPSERKPPSSGPTGGRQKPFHPSELGLGGRTYYYESADQVPPAWKDRSGSASG